MASVLTQNTPNDSAWTTLADLQQGMFFIHLRYSFEPPVVESHNVSNGNRRSDFGFFEEGSESRICFIDGNMALWHRTTLVR